MLVCNVGENFAISTLQNMVWIMIILVPQDRGGK